MASSPPSGAVRQSSFRVRWGSTYALFAFNVSGSEYEGPSPPSCSWDPSATPAAAARSALSAKRHRPRACQSKQVVRTQTKRNTASSWCSAVQCSAVQCSKWSNCHKQNFQVPCCRARIDFVQVGPSSLRLRLACEVGVQPLRRAGASAPRTQRLAQRLAPGPRGVISMTGIRKEKGGARRGGAHHYRDGAVERRGVGERLLRVARLRPHLPRASEPRRAGSHRSVRKQAKQ